MNHVAIFLISVFIGMHLAIMGLLYPEARGSVPFVMLSTAATVGLIGGALRELETALGVARKKRRGSY